MDLIQQAKEVFLTGVDEEDRLENLSEINRWEKEIIENENYTEWQQHDVTQKILKEMKEQYVDVSMQLMNGRALTEEQRNKLFATQDACVYLLSLIAKDAKGEVEQLQRDIRKKLSVF